MQIAALIPVKGFSNAKQRLGGLLSRAGREVLAEAMFRDVLREVLSARGLAATFVVTGDKDVAAIASAAGAEVIRESCEQGETSAVDFARARLKSNSWEAVLIIPGDMPLVRATDIELVLAQVPADTRHPFALLVPSHDRLGTNGLFLAPPDVIQLRFGYDSFRFHMDQLITHRLPPRFCENERIALDIDEPRDVERFLSYGVEDGETIKALRRLMAEADLWQTRSSGDV
ncbi:MAG TPA: 2-phospho-L-lactate guanylyltransferase [Candidatus Binatia bacterium]|jgi:2-phospho-L-lactate guanylyltransferase